MAETPNVDFDWSPKSVALSYTVSGNTYPPTHQQDGTTRASDARYGASTTPINTLLTFTATVTGLTKLFVVEYRWDFGDGIIGYGTPVTHTYLAANFNAQTTLNVTLSDNRQVSRHKVLNLRPADRIGIGMGVVVVPGTNLALTTSTTLTTTTTRVTQG